MQHWESYIATYERIGRHMKKRILYIGMAVMLAASMPMAAFADETVTGGTAGTTATSTTTAISDGKNHSIGGINYTGTRAAVNVSGTGTSVNIEGGINSEKGGGVTASGHSTSVVVNGDVGTKAAAADAKTQSKITINGNSENSGAKAPNIKANGNSSVIVSGDVKSEADTGIRASGNADVTVGGNVSGGTCGIYADGNKNVDKDLIEINVGKNVSGKDQAVYAINGASITIGGNAESNRFGVYASDNRAQPAGTDVHVKGDVNVVTTEKQKEIYGVRATGGAKVNVDGTVRIDDAFVSGGASVVKSSYDSIIKVGAIETDNAGIWANSGTVIVEGDVEHGREGRNYQSVFLQGSNSKVFIGGDLKTKADRNVIIRMENTTGDSELAVGGKIANESGLKMNVKVDSDGNALDLPEIVIGEITDPNKITIIDNRGNSVTEDTRQQVLDNIKYIVNSNPDSIEGKGSFTITKTDGGALSRDKADKYDVAKRQEQILVKVAVNNGYELGGFSAGKNNTYVRNADGSYTVTVADGGGINIEALIKAIEADPNPIKPTSFGGSNSSGGRTTVTNGTWAGSGAAANFRKADGSLAKNEWADINVNGKIYRFRFDENGNLKTGWYTDETGARYYLNEETGSYYGAMSTGWKLINGNWYYFVPYTLIRSGVSMNMGSMLVNGMTPDGFKVDANGIWIQ